MALHERRAEKEGDVSYEDPFPKVGWSSDSGQNRKMQGRMEKGQTFFLATVLATEAVY